MIERAGDGNADFRAARPGFWPTRRRPSTRVAEADVREMLIQHILTEEIFANGFQRPGNS